MGALDGLLNAKTAHTNNPQNELRALQLNVWLDATRVKGGLALCADTIIDSQADIVSLVEVKNLRGDFIKHLKKELQARGHTFYGNFAGNPLKFGLDADTAIISRFPVTEEAIVYRTRENCIVRSMIDVNGSCIAVYSVHLEYRCYTCYLPRGYHSNSPFFPGWRMTRHPSCAWFWGMVCQQQGEPIPVTNLDLIRQDNIASGRPNAIQHLLDDAHLHNVPVIIMGDFNEPSCLDWTEATADLADHNGLVYKWDSTELLRQNGFADSYRELYPNPVTHPGFTWPAAARGLDDAHPKKTSWIKSADERDRIDFIFSKRLKAEDAWLVGTPLTVARDTLVNESELYQDKFSHSVHSPWPSDHRAVMTVFRMER